MLETIQISDEEMAGLPDGTPGFLAFEALCREKLEELLKRYGEHDNDIDPRISYLTNILSAADYFDIPALKDLSFDPNDSFGYGEARSIAHIIQREVTRLRFRALKERHPSAVSLQGSQQIKLEHLIEQLRQRIGDSDIDAARKAKLLKKLSELEGLVRGGRPSFRDTMVILASLAALVNQAESAIIKLPDTIAAVAEVLGMAHAEAEAKALEDRSQKKALTDQSASSEAPDSDIPF